MFSSNIWFCIPFMYAKKTFLVLDVYSTSDIYNFGFSGWGVSEWHYRHYGGRPEAHIEADPVGIRHLPKY